MEDVTNQRIDDFIEERMEYALRELQTAIANDFADFMSERTGIHRDYYMPLGSEPWKY